MSAVPTLRQLRDLAERAVATAAQVFLASFTVTDLGGAKAAVLAGVAAGLSVVKSWLAATLPVGDDTCSMI